MWQNILEPVRPYMAIWCRCIVCWSPKSTNTPRICCTYWFSAVTVNECASMLHYTYIACLGFFSLCVLAEAGFHISTVSRPAALSYRYSLVACWADHPLHAVLLGLFPQRHHRCLTEDKDNFVKNSLHLSSYRGSRNGVPFVITDPVKVKSSLCKLWGHKGEWRYSYTLKCALERGKWSALCLCFYY
jgi:hypothetical protein